MSCRMRLLGNTIRLRLSSQRRLVQPSFGQIKRLGRIANPIRVAKTTLGSTLDVRCRAEAIPVPAAATRQANRQDDGVPSAD